MLALSSRECQRGGCRTRVLHNLRSRATEPSYHDLARRAFERADDSERARFCRGAETLANVENPFAGGGVSSSDGPALARGIRRRCVTRAVRESAPGQDSRRSRRKDGPIRPPAQSSRFRICTRAGTRVGPAKPPCLHGGGIMNHAAMLDPLDCTSFDGQLPSSRSLLDRKLVQLRAGGDAVVHHQ